MNDLNHTHTTYRIQTKAITGFALDYTDDLKKSLAKIKNPLDTIIDHQRIDYEYITKIKIKKYTKELNAIVRIYTS
ncbi:MAG: hypothetical protein ACON30_07865 [Flavobacteriaceae bacterium]